MVHTYTFEFYIFAIQTETGICIKIDVTETVGCLVSVLYFAVYQNFGLYIVQVRIFCAPQCRFVYCQGLFFFCCAVCCQCHIGGHCLRNCFALCIQDCCADLGCCLCTAVILDIGLYFNGNIAVFFCRQIWCSHICAVSGNMNGIGNDQLYVTVDTGS